MTDQLPAEFRFVSSASCTEVDAVTLSCDIDPLDLQVDDEPVVLTVTVQARPDAPSGTYTNLAFVDAPEDPMSEPTCLTDSNNVACETTDVRREASITVDKEARRRAAQPWSVVHVHDDGRQPWPVDVPRKPDAHRRSAGRAHAQLGQPRCGLDVQHGGSPRVHLRSQRAARCDDTSRDDRCHSRGRLRRLTGDQRGDSDRDR